MELLQSTGQMPTAAEIAQYCQLEEDKVQELLNLFPQVYSLDTPVGPDGEDDLQVLIENLHSPQPEEELVRAELKETMDTLLSMLTERQQEILRLRYGMVDGECWATKDIAEKFDISKQRVRQIEQQAMDKLKQMGADFGLEDFLE